MISTLIGVGFMGKGIAKNLALKGLSQSQGPPPISQLHLYDTNAVQVGTFLQSVQDDIQPEIKAQIQVLNDPTAVLGQSGFVALSLPSESVCDRLLFDKSDGIISKFASDQSSLSPGRRFIVDHGTYSRDFVLYCHERIKKTVRADLGATCAYIDAPVSGGPQGAWNGTLSIMMGGDKKCIDCILPILKLYSTRCVHFGPVGKSKASETPSHPIS